MANVQELRERGNEAFRRGDYEAAESLYSQAIAASSENSDVLLTNRARTRLRREKHREATQDAQEALSINPNNVKAWKCLADAEEALSNFLESVLALERGLEVARSNHETAELGKQRAATVTKLLSVTRRDDYDFDGIVIGDVGRLRDALGTREKNISRFDLLERAKNVMSFATKYRSVDPKWAEDCCASLLVLSSPHSQNPNPTIWSTTAYSWAGIRNDYVADSDVDGSKRLQLAFDICLLATEKLRDNKDEYGHACSNLAKLLVRMGRLNDGIAWYKEALENVNRQDRLTWVQIQGNLARNYERIGSLKEAVKALGDASKVLKKNEAPAFVMERARQEHLWAKTCLQLKDVKESELHFVNAKLDFQKVNRLVDCAKVLLDLADILKISDPPRARSVCREAIARLQHETHENARILRARLQFQLASLLCEAVINIDEAISLAEAALQVHDVGSIDWSQCQNVIGALLMKRGARSDYVRAVTCFEQAEEVVLKYGNNMTEWGMIQGNLGIAKRHLAKTKAEWDVAESHYVESIQALEKDIEEWAKTMSDLGVMILFSPYDSPQNNATRAVVALEQSLRVFSWDKHRLFWIRTTTNLGTALGTVGDDESVTRGVQLLKDVEQRCRDVDNVEDGILAMVNLTSIYLKRCRGLLYHENLAEALRLIERAKSMVYSSTSVGRKTLAKLAEFEGTVIEKQLSGSFTDNLLKALKCRERALQLYDRNEWPLEWASVQNNMGTFHMEFNHVDSDFSWSEKSLECFQNALEVFKEYDESLNVASVYRNMALMYLVKADSPVIELNDCVEALSNGIEACLSSLTTSCETEVSAITHAVLARLYTRFAGFDEDGKSEALTNAFEASDIALSWFKSHGSSIQWADTMMHLGLAHEAARSTELYEKGKAVECFKAALDVFSETSSPREWAITQLHLARALRKLGDDGDDTFSHEAVKRMSQAVRRLTQLRSQSMSSRATQAGHLAIDARELVGWLVDDGNMIEAWEHVQRAKALNVADLVTEASMTAPLGLEEADRARYNTLTDRIRILRHVLAREDCVVANDVVELERLYKERAELVGENDPELAMLLASAESSPVTLEELSSTFFADPHHSSSMIVDMLFGNAPPRSFLFCITFREGNSQLRVLQRVFQIDDLPAALRLGPKSPSAHRLMGSCLPLRELYDLIEETRCRDVVFAPHFIHSFPFHAISFDGEKSLADVLDSVRFVPNVRVLVTLHTREKQQAPARVFESYLGAAADPLHKLSAHDVEVRVVGALTKGTTLLEKEVTREALGFGVDMSRSRITPTTLHLACHGIFDPASPYDGSGLVVYSLDGQEKEVISVNDVFTRGTATLKSCRLVVLSACSTALAPISRGDEMVGLPAAFLYAGAATVLASRWSVRDYVTALLFCKVFEILQETTEMKVWRALWKAQCWLRGLDEKKRREEFDKRRRSLKMEENEEVVEETNTIKREARSREAEKVSREDVVGIFSNEMGAYRPATQDNEDADISSGVSEDLEWTAFMCWG